MIHIKFGFLRQDTEGGKIIDFQVVTTFRRFKPSERCFLCRDTEGV